MQVAFFRRDAMDFDTREQVIKLAFFDAIIGSVRVDGHRHAKSAAIEAFVEDAQATAIEEEHFEGGAAFAEKHIECSISGVSLKMFRDDATEAFEAPAEVDGGVGKVDFDTGWDHGAPWERWSVARTADRVGGSKPG